LKKQENGLFFAFSILSLFLILATISITIHTGSLFQYQSDFSVAPNNQKMDEKSDFSAFSQKGSTVCSK